MIAETPTPASIGARSHMRAVTVIPGSVGSSRLDEVPEPGPELGSILVEALAVGVCGTDVEITSGGYGWAPPGRERLILGHESLGRVIDPGPSGFAVGDHVVGIVRRPDPVPCANCAVGEWDMCSNGGYTERGIKQVDGFMSDRWRIEPEYAVKVDQSLGILGVLLEPTTVVEKAWEHIISIGRRTFWDPGTVLVTGAGPIGLLAALIGMQYGNEVHVLDRATSGSKPALVEALGAKYHTGLISDIGISPDIVIECTGVAPLIRQAAEVVSPGAIVCLTGVGPPIVPAASAPTNLPTDVVLKNLVLFGTVNANRRHYYRAAQVLARADRTWLERLVTRRVAPEDFQDALQRQPDDIKVVIEFAHR
jgi:threonine dehydrogenase-like Zn-dependent dehydrogenase